MSSSSRPKAVGAGRATTSGNLSTAVTGGKVQHTGTDSVNRSTEHSRDFVVNACSNGQRWGRAVYEY